MRESDKKRSREREIMKESDKKRSRDREREGGGGAAIEIGRA